MGIDKSLMKGSTTMLILGMLDNEDMYGYQMIEELKNRSENIFEFKAGTLYPLLHSLVKDDVLEQYEKESDNGKIRKYYHLTKKGKELLEEKKQEWKNFASTVNGVLEGRAFFGAV